MELEGKKGDFDYAQSPKHLPENLRNPNGADRCLSGAEGSGYKQTEIGVIPDDWCSKKLGHIGKTIGGLTGKTKSDFGRGNSKYITFLNVLMNIKIDISILENVLIKPIEHQNSFTKGDLFFNTSSETPKEVGMCAILLDEIERIYLNSFCFGFRLTEVDIDGLFLCYLINSDIGRNIFESIAQGATRYNLSKTNFSNIEFSFPPLPEQQKIAEALSDTDELIQTLKKLIAKKKDIKQGAMQELLSGKRRLEGFDGEWENVKLGEMLDYIQPTNFIVKSTEYSQTGNLPVLTAGKSFILGYTSEDFGVFEAIPVIIFDDFTTASKFVDFRFKVKSSAMKILKLKSDQFNIRFVFEIMKMIVYPLGDHKRHWIGEYQKIEVFVPGVKEQTAIAQIISDMDAEIEALEKQLQKTELLKQGMMQELLTGRIRLIKPEAERLAMVAEPKQNYKTH